MSSLFKFSVIDLFRKFSKSGLCWMHMGKVLKGVRNKELWSLQMLDASSKISSSILTGNVVDLGNYDECLQVAVPHNEFQGKQCFVSWPVPIGNQTLKLHGISLPLVSYCVPSSCSAKDVLGALTTLLPSIFNKDIAVDDRLCQVKQTNSYSAVDLFSIYFFAIILFIVVASTVYDLLKTSKLRSDDLLRSFSILTNGKDLFKVNPLSDHTIGSLNGIRFFSMILIFITHGVLASFTTPSINFLNMYNEISNMRLLFLLSGSMAVDTFFFMSGLLNTLHLFKFMDSTKRFPSAMYFIHRYIRLTPAYAACVLMSLTWLVHIGDGPTWNFITEPMKKDCIDNWWANLLYINNYYNPNSTCLVQSWYLSADMQLYWIAPLVIWLCWKWPKLRKLLLTSLLILSTIIVFVVSYYYKIRSSQLIRASQKEMDMIARVLHKPTHMRATPYILGIGLGIFMHEIRKRKEVLHLSRWKVLTGWVLSTFLFLIVVLGQHPLLQSEENHPYNGLESSSYISLYPIAWCCGVSWIIVACHTGYGGIVNDFLSWNVFACLGRLCYCMYLTSTTIQIYQIGIIRIPSYFSYFNFFYQFLGDLIISFIASIILHLLFESPIIMIEKYFKDLKAKKNALDKFSLINGGGHVKENLI